MNNLNMNCVSFKGKYLIPYNQIKNEETLMNIGQASNGYVTRPEQLSEAPDGVVVDIDDKKAKEYEAVIAKYGVSIQKYDPSKAANKKIAFNGNAPEEPSETQAPEKQVAFHGNPAEPPKPEVTAATNIKEAPTPENPIEANPAEK